MKRFISFALCFVLVISLSVIGASAYNIGADAELISPRYEVISNVYISLDISSSGKASCYADVNTSPAYSCDLTVELQEKSGSSWTTIKTWTATDDGTGYTYVDGTWYVLPGAYQLKVTIEVYNSRGVLVEDPIEYSDTRYY